MYVNVRPSFSTVVENSKGLRSWKFDPVYANIAKKTCWLTPTFLEKLPNLTLMIYPLSSSDKINSLSLIIIVVITIFVILSFGYFLLQKDPSPTSIIVTFCASRISYLFKQLSTQSQVSFKK